MIGIVPISNLQEEITIWGRIRKRDDYSVIHLDAAIAACSLQKPCGREVEVAPYLIFHLKEIREVLPGKNRTVRT